LRSAESQIPQLETAIQLQRRTSFVDVQQAEAALAAARARLDEVRHGARPQELEQARQVHLAAQTRLENARTDLARAQDLFRAGSQPRKAVDTAQMMFDVAQAEERRARESLGLLTEGTRSEVVAAAEARVRELESGIARARLSELLVTKLEQQVVTARAEVESARAAYKVAVTQRGYASLVSPANAWVLAQDARAGEVVGVGSKVFTLANLDALYTQVYLDELDARQLKQGQRAVITAEALPGRSFEGQVTAIYIQTRRDQVQRSCRIRTTVKNQGAALKPGMRVRTAFPE
jgi:multidrug resistance efflux pump